MHPRKRQYSNEIYNLVTSSCMNMADEKNRAIPQLLNITADDARELIRRIVTALPDDYFYNATEQMRYGIFAFISKNFILFQCQEDIDSDDYAYHLIDFIRNLSSNIARRYYAN
ncbi:hypothetical protein BN59_01253 [Legionella massiliensis]|uniref:Uncharacterized protein n=1 Tax=Legionella massiliensis TaxID=1034943 RepID=A0A078KYY7_9GAMM|nr:hypothetical protein [Legionella massiliensis]CDZ76974.1 hypothetical protein BN59_01253 [Legionella massiliensis]CEE12712.1 hypothetical protein BN1094_01253 [Legionella massiliensis]